MTVAPASLRTRACNVLGIDAPILHDRERGQLLVFSAGPANSSADARLLRATDRS